MVRIFHSFSAANKKQFYSHRGYTRHKNFVDPIGERERGERADRELGDSIR